MLLTCNYGITCQYYFAVVYDASSKEDATPATTVSKRNMCISAIRIDTYGQDVRMDQDMRISLFVTFPLFLLFQKNSNMFNWYIKCYFQSFNRIHEVHEM
jgi:hypothetical protein